MSTILLIEDSATQAEWFKLMLVDEGYEVVNSESLAGGLAIVQQGSVNLILLDLTLPDSDGLETFRKARKSAPNTPIVVLTNMDDEQVAATALREGAQDYLVKDEVNQNWLNRSIKHALARPRAKATGTARPKQATREPVEVEETDGVAVLRLRVNRLLDADDITCFDDCVQKSIQAGCVKLAINLGDVDYVSNSALAAMVNIHRRVQANNGTTCLCHVRPNVYEQLVLRKFHKLFDIQEDVDSALQTLRSN